MASQENRVEKKFEENDRDIFDEVFGKDKEREVARKHMQKRIEEEKRKEAKNKEENKKELQETELEKNEEKESKKKIKEKTNAVDSKLDFDKIKKVILEKAKASVEGKLPIDKEVGTVEEGTKELTAETKAVEEVIEMKTAEDKGTIAVDKKPEIYPLLKFLETRDGNVFIGRKKSVFQKYSDEAALFIGKVDDELFKGKSVLLDGLNPHVVFVCGARGSGKSYVLGVIAEELALKNPNVGIVVVDPIGVFWSMKFPNKEEREINLLAKWNLMPQGLESLKVFIPEGMKSKVPASTYDATFSIQPSLLTTDDWCLTFGIERFSPTGLLLEKAMNDVRHGYKTKGGHYVKAKKNDYSLDDLITCLETSEEIHSPDRGYKQDSIRALVSRFDAAKGWGIFDHKGTPLAELSREGQLTIIDTSFLEDNVSSLVIGILARRILAARKISTRKEAASRFKKIDVDQLLEMEIPPTWLFIDEAHTLIPSGNIRTPATNSLIEYVKQGRQPGCSLVFATQQPSAIDTRVLSQLDVIITHKLVFDDDIKAVYKRTPAVIPGKFKKSNFIKTLPVGVALVGDRREETSRAFVMKIRPRMSQHEGREAVTTERKISLQPDEVHKLALGMAFSKLESEGKMEVSKIDTVVQTLASKYKSKIKLSDVLSALEEKGAVINPKDGVVYAPNYKEEEMVEELSKEIKEEELEEETKLDELKSEKPEEIGDKTVEVEPKTELLAFPVRITDEEARIIFNKKRKKKFLGLVGQEERFESMQLKFIPIYKVKFNQFNQKNVFNMGEAYINSFSGEFIHYKNGFIESKGLSHIFDLREDEVKVLKNLDRNKRKDFHVLLKETSLDEVKLKRILGNLMEKNLAAREIRDKKQFFFLKEPIDLPPSPLHPLVSSLGKVPVSSVETLSIERERFPKESIPKVLKKLWNNVLVREIDTVYLPVYEATFTLDNRKRILMLNAVTKREMK